jgi:hypothetical protein
MLGEEPTVVQAQEKLPKDNVEHKQQEDPVWGPVLDYLEGDKTGEAPPLALNPNVFAEEGILYFRKVERKPNRMRKFIIIPDTLKNEALTLAHDSNVGAHLGRTKTWKRLLEFGFWINMTKDVYKFVDTCMQCQKRKMNNRIVVPMGNFPAIDKPLERVGVDLIEMPPSNEGHKYILTLVDHFSRYRAAFPLRSKTT